MAFTTPFEASQSEDQVTSSICYMFVVIIGKHSVNQFFRLWNSIEIIGVLRFKNNSKILLTDIFDLRHDYRQVWLSVELRSSTGEVIFWNCFFLNYSIKKSKFFHILHVVNNSNPFIMVSILFFSLLIHTNVLWIGKIFRWYIS